MREIWFRGKRIDNGEWIEGYYCPFSYGSFPCTAAIVPEPKGKWEAIKVIPKTVCLFTGLKDKNFKLIFEGDIVRYTFDMPNDITATENGKKVRIGMVFFSELRASFSITADRKCSGSINQDLYKYVRNGNRVEVIGNIWDNPELFELEV